MINMTMTIMHHHRLDTDLGPSLQLGDGHAPVLAHCVHPAPPLLVADTEYVLEMLPETGYFDQ